MGRVGAEQDGFTLIELLVVILIIGVLAEIAIPSFVGQASKAHDAVAKSYVFTAQTAIETYRTDHGSVCGADPGDLTSIEPALQQANQLRVSTCFAGSTDSYTLSVRSDSSQATMFSVTDVTGQVERDCSPVGQGGCRTDGSW
jgi:type IV pilus assembly protein PilA